MCWQGCGKVQDWRGKFWLLWAFSFCNLKLLSAPEMLGSSSAIALLYLSQVLASSASAEQLWSPFLQFEPPWKEAANTGSSCGNMKLQTSSSTKLMRWCRTWTGEYQHQGWSLQKPLATACERSAAEGIQYAAFHVWLQKHVGETVPSLFLFIPLSHLPKADYRKLPETQRCNKYP